MALLAVEIARSRTPCGDKSVEAYLGLALYGQGAYLMVSRPTEMHEPRCQSICRGGRRVSKVGAFGQAKLSRPRPTQVWHRLICQAKILQLFVKEYG